MATRILSSVFGGAVRLRNSLYDAGALPARHLKGPVVSVGNLSVGGSGKTPFVILLGELLHSRGVAFNVLSRGYRRQTSGVALVDPGGLPREFGDEPLLIARRLQIPVILGEDRHAAGIFAEQRFGPQLHLLDDGFQHRQLARDFDIVLVTPDDARDRLLPAGRLREPLGSLRRADAVVLASGADPANFPLDGKTVWRVRRGILTRDLPPHPLAFCGIARPQGFFAQLRKAGIDVSAEVVFPDHHPYTDKDLRDLQFVAEQNQAGGFVTTEKDAVNLGGFLSSLKPLSVVPVKMDFADAPRALDYLLETLKSRGKPVS
ncbi:MAG: tetraacyldisaccharide 4'-kinase [Acidobacteriia bacterium]|nr:tetraacyldisaccharide 4'-kinase [Terriglobia bacterium]